MKISNHQTRWIFGVLLEQAREADVIRFDHLDFKFRPSAISKESLRNLLKMCDFDYPRDSNGIPLSYTKLNTKEMNRHVEWVIDTVSLTHPMRFVEEEWDRLMDRLK